MIYPYVPGISERIQHHLHHAIIYIHCPILNFNLVFLYRPRIDCHQMHSLWRGSPLYCSFPVVCSGQRSEASSCVALLAAPGAGRLSQPADSLSRCSSSGRPCHCFIPPLLCPAPLSTSFPTPYVLLFLCRC